MNSRINSPWIALERTLHQQLQESNYQTNQPFQSTTQTSPSQWRPSRFVTIAPTFDFHLWCCLLTDAHQNAANYVSETVQGAGAQTSKTANKEVAKDSDANLSTRANAAVDALGDKKDEHVHNAKADVHKGMSDNMPSRIYGIIYLT